MVRTSTAKTVDRQISYSKNREFHSIVHVVFVIDTRETRNFHIKFVLGQFQRKSVCHWLLFVLFYKIHFVYDEMMTKVIKHPLLTKKETS